MNPAAAPKKSSDGLQLTVTSEQLLEAVKEALRNGQFSAEQIGEIEGACRPAEAKVGISSPASAPALTPVPDQFQAVRQLVTEAGGVFIGKEELIRLGKATAETNVPALPEGIEAFLKETHPIRGHKIASHVILAFDQVTKEWVCVDRGSGGKSDIVPGSLGKEGLGMGGAQQDRLLKLNGAAITVKGAVIESPTNSCPDERAINLATACHLQAGNFIDDIPFGHIWGRTADTRRSAAGCRLLLGFSSEGGLCGYVLSHSVYADPCYVGLLASWNLKNLDR